MEDGQFYNTIGPLARPFARTTHLFACSTMLARSPPVAPPVASHGESPNQSKTALNRSKTARNHAKFNTAFVCI